MHARPVEAPFRLTYSMLSRLPPPNGRLVAVNIVIGAALHEPFNSPLPVLNTMKQRLLETWGVISPSFEQLIGLEIDIRRQLDVTVISFSIVTQLHSYLGLVTSYPAYTTVRRSSLPISHHVL
jgi:hypothetical protein